MKKTRNEWDSNRMMAAKSSNRGYWCRCDEYFIAPGQRCPACGKRNKKKQKPKYN